jgi:DNA-binding GntR family transcriptional regulator
MALATVSKPGSQQIQRETLAKTLTRLLRDKILAGDYPEGQQLRQDALAIEFGISRIPVREALRQLEAEGLVSFYPHRGAVVSSLSLQEIEELFDVRAVLEPDLLRRAMPNLTEEVLERAGEVLDQAQAAFEQESDVGVWGALNWRFHSTLYAPAERPQTMAIVEKLNRNIDRYLRIQLLLTHGTSQAMEDHRAILEACRRRDAREATRIVRNHIREASQELIQCLRQERAVAATRREATARSA